MYPVLKDFAGPVATIIAAGAAAYFVRRQALTAEQQAATALDQLRYSLFEKRYNIYSHAREVIIYLLNNSNREDFSAFDVIVHYHVMKEACFFYSEDIVSWLVELENDCQSFLVAYASKDPAQVFSSQ